MPHQYGFTVPKRRGEPQRPESAARERHRTASICIAEPKPQTLKLVGCHVLRNQNRGRSISRTTTAPKRKYHVLRNQNRSRFNLPTQNGSGFILPNQNGIESEVSRLAEPKPQPLNQPTQNGSGSTLPNQNGIDSYIPSALFPCFRRGRPFSLPSRPSGTELLRPSTLSSSSYLSLSSRFPLRSSLSCGGTDPFRDHAAILGPNLCDLQPRD